MKTALRIFVFLIVLALFIPFACTGQCTDTISGEGGGCTQYCQSAAFAWTTSVPSLLQLVVGFALAGLAAYGIGLLQDR